MFKVLPKNSKSIKVGVKQSAAKLFIKDVNGVLEFLDEIVQKLSKN